jgi:glycosyltransferase involved in cell wall biosynthesis
VARILLVTPAMPYPPEQGASLRNFSIIRGLSARHAIHLFTFAPAGPTTPIPIPLAELCAEVAVAPLPRRSPARRLAQLLVTRQPDMAKRLMSDAADAQLAAVVSRHDFDVAQFEGLEVAPLMALVSRLSPGIRLVYDAHNAESALQWRVFQADLRRPGRWPAALYSLIQARRLATMERGLVRLADATVAVSQADAALLDSFRPRRTPLVIPNSIDVQEVAEPPAETIHFDLLFSGKMDYRPNVDAVLWLADKVLPLIRHRRPEVTWAIVGREPHPRLERLTRLPGVTITGRVESLRPYLAGASVVVLPLRMGSGTRLKLLEAMAAGKAIVSTRLGAEGYPVSDGGELLLADEPADFAAAILRLLDEPALAERLGVAGRRLAARYDWRQIIPAFDELIQSLLD